MTRRSERTRSGRYQRAPTTTTLPGLHDDRPHGRADASDLPAALRDPRLTATAPMLPPGWSLVRIAGGPARPALALSCANQPWTGQGTLASYCVTLTPRFANPF